MTNNGAQPVTEHSNLLSGRKNGQHENSGTMAAGKENPLRRKSSDKKLFKTPNNLRNSAGLIKSNTNASSTAGLTDKQILHNRPSPQPHTKQASALGQIGNAMRDLSPTSAIINA